MNITLTTAEQKLAIYMAKCRHATARNSAIRNCKMGKQGDYETDLEGIAAEIAFCKMMNVYPDLQVGVRPDEDATLPTGQTVDVKTTKYKNGRLLAVRWKKPVVDLFALMVGEFPTYRFVGFKHCDDMLKEENLKDLGHGPGYAVDQCDLELPEK